MVSIQKDDLKQAILALDLQAKEARRVEGLRLEGYDGDRANQLELICDRLRAVFRSM